MSELARSAAFHLKVSRPGLWFPTLWLYLLPLAGDPLPRNAAFWAGLLFVSLPLNHLVYGWNDVVDVETDRLNPRKDSYLFGARGGPAELRQLPVAIAGLQGLSWAVLALLGGLDVLLVGAGILAVLALYNHPSRGLRSRPPWDLVSQAGYLLVVLLSARLNDVATPGPLVFGYLALFCAQSQLIGEVMDIGPDRAAGRSTTATMLGTRRTKWLIIAVVAAEVAILGGPLGDPLFALGLAGFLGWLLLDQLVLFKDGQYTLGQMKLFGVLGNLCAVASMAWVWWRGGLGG